MCQQRQTTIPRDELADSVLPPRKHVRWDENNAIEDDNDAAANTNDEKEVNHTETNSVTRDEPTQVERRSDKISGSEPGTGLLLQIGPNVVQTTITDFLTPRKTEEKNDRVLDPLETVPVSASHREDENGVEDKKPAAVDTNRNDSSDVVAFVKSTPMCASDIIYTPVALSVWDSENLPDGVTLTNDFFGPDPNRLVLSLDDNVEEIPDFMLDVLASVCEENPYQKHGDLTQT